MQGRRLTRLSIVVSGLLLALSVSASAFIELPIFTDPISLFRLTFTGLPNTGFSIRSLDGNATFEGSSKYDPARITLQQGERVQEGFVLLDGTLSLDVTGTKGDGTRSRMRTTYRMDVRRDSLRRENLARALFRQGVVRDLPRGRVRASAMRLEDARVMRLVRHRDGSSRWTRAVRALGRPRSMVFRPRKDPSDPDVLLGHFGTARSQDGDAYVWAVMDRNSRYAVGVTVDRDNDGVANFRDNCIGSPNSNQLDTDGDEAGNACDLDDDNDQKLDAADNCPLNGNADQADFDNDSIGNVCDFDDDNDAVSDGTDSCQGTALGSIVDGNGCSIVEYCPCQSEWRNHGAYVKCVAKTSESFVAAALITSAQKDAIVSSAAGSSCGH